MAGSNKWAAGLLAIFLGTFGTHKYYLGDKKKALLYFLFSWTLVPTFLGLKAGLRFLFMDGEEFEAEHGSSSVELPPAGSESASSASATPSAKKAVGVTFAAIGAAFFLFAVTAILTVDSDSPSDPEAQSLSDEDGAEDAAPTDAETDTADATTEEGTDATETADEEPRLSVAAERVSPDSETVEAYVSETVRFEAQCQNPNESLDYATWEVREPGATTFQTAVNDSAFLQDDPWGPKPHSVSFDQEGTAAVRWTCVEDSGLADATSWQLNVTESDTEASETSSTENETNSSDASTDEQAPGASFVQSSFTPETPIGNLTVDFIDVGQGDGMVLQFPDQTVVIDTGPWQGTEEHAVQNYLDSEGISTVHALILSHPEADHSGGCDEVLATVTVSHVVHPGASKDTNAWEDCETAIENEGAEVFTDGDVDPSQYLNLSTYASSQVWNVDQTSVNEGSVVLHVEYGDVDFAFTGDIGCETEDALIDRGVVEDIDVLKVAHHGSKYSTCTNWLDATRPETGVISLGDNNYGHPAQETLDRLASHSVNVFRTDENGDVTVRTNGQTYDVVPETPSTDDGSDDSDGATDDTTADLVVTASISDPQPCQNSDVTVTIEVTDQEGNPMEGAETTSTWHYKTTDPSESGTTDSSGVDEHTRDIGRASAGYEVDVDVDVKIGDRTGQASTSFTPQDC